MSDSLFGKDMDTVFINDKTPWLTVKCRRCQSGHFQKFFYKSSRRFFDGTEIFHGFPFGIFLIPHHIYFRISNCHQDDASHALFWHFAFQMSHTLEAASNTFWKQIKRDLLHNIAGIHIRSFFVLCIDHKIIGSCYIDNTAQPGLCFFTALCIDQFDAGLDPRKQRFHFMVKLDHPFQNACLYFILAKISDWFACVHCFV